MEQLELLGRGLRRHLGRRDVGVALEDAALAAAGLEAVDNDADGHAGAAAGAGGLVERVLAAPEAGHRSRGRPAVRLARLDQRHQPPLLPARQIGAGARSVL